MDLNALCYTGVQTREPVNHGNSKDTVHDTNMKQTTPSLQK